MKLNRNITTGILLFLVAISLSQNIKDLYLFPIKPGEQNFLAGNMGEIRPRHFHTGIDIKTEGRQGLPVYAAANGHVYRMKISSFGYGNVLYLRHINGQATVYAHLKEFEEGLAAYMKEKIYETRKNELEYFPEADELPVRKGEIIAYSGNTGSSGGPHLHFEIRDSLDRAIDPLHFGFTEIVDTTPPTARRVAITPLDAESRVNGMHRRQEFSLVYRPEGFRVNQTIRISGKVGIQVFAYDKLDGMYNLNGFPIFETHHNNQIIFRSEVNPVNFELGRFIFAHTYRNRYVRLYKTPNNLFNFYEPDTAFSGAITALPDERKEINVKLKDVYGNTTNLFLDFLGEEAPALLRSYNYTSENQSIEYKGNLMLINTPNYKEGDLARFYVHGYEMEIPYAYEGTNKRTYIWDMNNGIPDSINVCSQVLVPEVNAKIPSGQQMNFNNGRVQLKLEDKTLLSDLFLRLGYIDHDNFKGISINDPYEYLWNPLEVTYEVPEFEGDKDHTQMYLLHANGYKKFIGGDWNDRAITFRTRELGKFILATDSIPPRIRPIRINRSQIRFSIADDLSGIQDFDAWVDGQWIQLKYEHKYSVIWSDPPKGKVLEGEIMVKVRDKANNEAIYRGNI
ncbi:MAG: M23 family metallopeptidase [Cyclobacteriaceae bacterium]